tara:strand:+ start:179 stop:622 length:444 start_codon:yes stop_codon:yes gene_type:complete
MLRIPITRKRIYTEDFLEANRTTAKAARAAGKLGLVQYQIDTIENSEARGIIDAYIEQKRLMESGEAPLLEIDIDPKVVAKICCALLLARKQFFKDLLNMVPWVRLRHSGESNTSEKAPDGSYSIETPGYIDVRMDASEETRQHLGL